MSLDNVHILPFGALLLLPLLALSAPAGCTDGDRPAPKPTAHATATRPSARLVIMTDLQGYLEPCGCQARPLGGIDRATARLEALRAEGIPMAVLAAGDLLFETGTAHKRADDKARVQEVWKAETLVGILNKVPLAAALPGRGDLRFGRDTFDQLTSRASFPLLRKTGDDDRRLISRKLGPTKVAVLGLSGLDADADAAFDARTLAGQAQALVARARGRGANVIVALVEAPTREARRMAGRVSGIDFLVIAGRDQDDAHPPSQVGNTSVLTGARHGRGLLVLDLYRNGQGPFSDASEWTRRAAQAASQRQVTELRARIRAWEQDPDVDRAQLARQRARLTALEKQAEDGSAPNVERGNAFSARLIELDPQAPKQPATTALLADYDRRVNEHNRMAFADWKPEPVAAGQASYVGSEQCRTCHQSAYSWWQGHPHGHAYTTLETRNKQFNLSCVGCHVTGYLQPGGATVTHNKGLTHVGCEACHGPGSLHNGNPEAILRAPQASTCIECHNEEHSAGFDFDTYRARLIVPGHGLPPSKPQPDAQHDSQP